MRGVVEKKLGVMASLRDIIVKVSGKEEKDRDKLIPYLLFT